MTKHSISAAHRITGKSRTTITKHISSGKLSCTEDDEGNKLIDASELMRVYGAACDFSREEGASAVSSPASNTEQGVQPSLSSLEALLEKEVSERERERGQLQRQIDNLQDALKLAQEGQNKAMLLLQDKTSGGGEWQQALKALEAKITNQEQGTRKELAKVAEQAAQSARMELLSKPWWKVAFAPKVAG